MFGKPPKLGERHEQKIHQCTHTPHAQKTHQSTQKTQQCTENTWQEYFGVLIWKKLKIPIHVHVFDPKLNCFRTPLNIKRDFMQWGTLVHRSPQHVVQSTAYCSLFLRANRIQWECFRLWRVRKASKWGNCWDGKDKQLSIYCMECSSMYVIRCAKQYL